MPGSSSSDLLHPRRSLPSASPGHATDLLRATAGTPTPALPTTNKYSERHSQSYKISVGSPLCPECLVVWDNKLNFHLADIIFTYTTPVVIRDHTASPFCPSRKVALTAINLGKVKGIAGEEYLAKDCICIIAWVSTSLISFTPP
uniref:Uncharacterized protein n=1 Tax=Oryza rufipogon TaxID=4529 RepID=A0A0E0NE73_ORYRU